MSHLPDFTGQDGARWRGYALAVAAAVLWSVIGPLSRACFEAGIQPGEVAFWRLALGGLCFLLHASLRGECRTNWHDGSCFILFGIFGVASFFLSLQLAIERSGAALAVILMNTAPAWVAIFSRLLFKEHISRGQLLALVLAMAGTALVCLSGGSLGGPTSFLGLACGLLSGFTYALQYPFFVWWKDRYSTAMLFAATFLPAAAVLLPFTSFAENKPLSVWLVLLALGTLTTYGAYFTYGLSLRLISPVRAAIISNLEPVLGTFLAWLFWNEMFLPIGWAGCALVLLAVVLLTLRRE